MIIDVSNARIFIHPGSADLRKGVSGLTAVVQEKMKENPFSGSVYIFCNRERKLIKAVYWDKTGFWLSHRTLWVRSGWKKTSTPGRGMKAR